MRAFYTDRFVLPLPDGHRFPMVKYSRLRERCIAERVLSSGDLREPRAAEWAELGLVHDAVYMERVRSGELSQAEQRRIGFPWSAEMVERSRRSAGATILAGITALEEARSGRWGVAVNLAGGTHHAHPGHGEGFCVFNDAAVAVRVLQASRLVDRVAIVDCDVHQGNGTAAIFANDPDVFTFSINGAKNYPFRRERSTIDVDLPDGTADEAYLAALELYLPHVLGDFQPELVIYLAGADPFHDDRYGRLSLTKQGLARRDELVLRSCRNAAIPVVVTMAGGYARDTEDTVDIHLRTIETARTVRECKSADVRE
ncbi:MAG: histone deacetylase [Gemmatimonadetes bacterium]|nr:histone deacetylase [Gemmatimonadota bacterium]